MAIIIGLDISLSNSGIVKLDTENNTISKFTIKTHPNPNRMARLEKFWKIFLEIIDDYCFGDKVLANKVLFSLEDYSYAIRNSRSLISLAEQGGLIRFHFHKIGANLQLYAPAEVKKFATGKGNAKKELMIKAVYKKWGFDTNDQNLADGYVVARLRLAQYELQNELKQMSDFLEYEKSVLLKYEKR